MNGFVKTILVHRHYAQFISYRTYNSLNFYYMNLTDNREPETQENHPNE